MNYLKLKEKKDVLAEFKKIEKFREYQNRLARGRAYQNKFTICFDILNVFLAELNPFCDEDMMIIENQKEIENSLLVVRR